MSESRCAGATLDSPVYRDGTRLILKRNANTTALATLGILLKSEYDAIISTAGGTFPYLNTTGIVQCGPSEALSVSFAGAGNDNILPSFMISAFEPVFAVNDPGCTVITGYVQYPMVLGTFTLSNISDTSFGMGNADDIFGDTTIAATDRIADTITPSFTATYGVRILSPGNTDANIGPARVIVQQPGAHFFYVQTKLAAANNTFNWAFGKRVFPILP